MRSIIRGSSLIEVSDTLTAIIFLGAGARMGGARFGVFASRRRESLEGT